MRPKAQQLHLAVLVLGFVVLHLWAAQTRWEDAPARWRLLRPGQGLLGPGKDCSDQAGSTTLLAGGRIFQPGWSCSDPARQEVATPQQRLATLRKQSWKLNNKCFLRQDLPISRNTCSRCRESCSLAHRFKARTEYFQEKRACDRQSQLRFLLLRQNTPTKAG